MASSKEEYCSKYFIPEEYLWEILEDAKVVPMIRGKATEYNAFLFLQTNLDKHVFSVDKLNLNAQTDEYDEDVSITHRATGVRLKVEVKNAVRGSFSTGQRAKFPYKDKPHFKVKCHRSRSNIALADTTNDRYLPGEFDIVMSNVLNAIYEGATYTSEMQFIDRNAIELLKGYYHVTSNRDLEIAANQDWRFAFPDDIAEECRGVMAIPRTPYVLLREDPHWFSFDRLPELLERRAIEMAKERKKKGRY